MATQSSPSGSDGVSAEPTTKKKKRKKNNKKTASGMSDTRGGGLMCLFAQRFANGSPTLDASKPQTLRDAAKCLLPSKAAARRLEGSSSPSKASASATHATNEDGLWCFETHWK